ncbi:MAG TPA: RNA methyltransferase [Chitinophagaceae bacterium]|nr:RNA methyltransferase [Chitinophagaceae bacterium]
MLGKSKVKYIQSLGQKKHRDEEGLFIAEGPKLLAELLASPGTKIREIYAVNEWIKENKVSGDIAVIEVAEDDLGKISQLSTPNKAIALVEKFPIAEPVVLSSGLFLALDTIQDPGNMGTIIRIADWFGISTILCSHECADRYNPKVVQATMGSIARVNVFYTDLASWLGTNGDVPVYAAVLNGDDIGRIPKPAHGVIVIGNESKGVSPSVMHRINREITIPRIGEAESLNAAVATGIILSHLV